MASDTVDLADGDELSVRFRTDPQLMELDSETVALVRAGMELLMAGAFGATVEVTTGSRTQNEVRFGVDIRGRKIDKFVVPRFSACFHELSVPNPQLDSVGNPTFFEHECRDAIAMRQPGDVYCPVWPMTPGDCVSAELSGSMLSLGASRPEADQSVRERLFSQGQLRVISSKSSYRFSEIPRLENRPKKRLRLSIDASANTFEIGFGPDWGQDFERQMYDAGGKTIVLLVDGWVVFEALIPRRLELADGMFQMRLSGDDNGPLGLALLGILVSSGYASVSAEVE